MILLSDSYGGVSIGEIQYITYQSVQFGFNSPLFLNLMGKIM